MLAAGWAHIESAEVWLQLSCKDLESCGLANAIGAHEAQHLTSFGRWQPAESPSDWHHTTMQTVNIEASMITFALEDPACSALPFPQPL